MFIYQLVELIIISNNNETTNTIKCSPTTALFTGRDSYIVTRRGHRVKTLILQTLDDWTTAVRCGACKNQRFYDMVVTSFISFNYEKS